jgi:hypothetical protein
MDLVKALPRATRGSCSNIGDQAWLVESDLHTLPDRAYTRAFCKTQSACRRETSLGNAKQECELLRSCEAWYTMAATAIGSGPIKRLSVWPERTDARVGVQRAGKSTTSLAPKTSLDQSNRCRPS